MTERGPLCATFSVLWFVGSSGSGKPEASYWTYATLLERGLHVGRIDTDDVGRCRPAPAADEANLRVEAAGLDRPGVAARVLDATGWPGAAPEST